MPKLTPKQLGRPTDCTPALIKDAWEYLNEYKSKHEDAIPSHAGMAIALNVHRSTLYRWAKEEDKPFNDILETCNTLQEKLLINGGLDMKMNSNIVKLVLGKHGYHEKQEVGTLQNESLTPVERAAKIESILNSARERSDRPVTH